MAAIGHHRSVLIEIFGNLDILKFSSDAEMYTHLFILSISSGFVDFYLSFIITLLLYAFWYTSLYCILCINVRLLHFNGKASDFICI